MGNNKFGFLDDTNAFLGDVTGYADKAFANVTEWSQVGLDVATAEVYYNMSKSIEFCRQKTIKALHNMFSGYLDIISNLGPLANMSITDPLALLKPVLEIVKIITKPYYEALSIVTEMTPKVIELSNNLQKIANYRPPTIDIKPSSTTSKYLVVGSITMSEIQSGKPNPINIIKPNLDDIVKSAQKQYVPKFQEATATQAETVTGNRDKNMLKSPDQRTSVDPTGGGGEEGTVNPEQLAKWEQEILGFTQSEANIAARIGILEQTVFAGQTYNGSLSARMKNLEAGIKKWRSQITLKAQEEVQSSQAVSNALNAYINGVTNSKEIQKEIEEAERYLFD